MQTSAGRAAEAMERCGRSGHTFSPAATQTALARTSTTATLVNIRNDYNRCIRMLRSGPQEGAMISRRNFGKLVMAGTSLPLFGADGAVRVGLSTYSFRDLVRTPGRDNIDDIVQAVRQSGVTDIELSSANTEPAGPNSGPAVPPPPSVYPDPIKTPTPAEVAAAKLAVRNSLRDWRLRTPAGAHGAVRDKFH